MLSKLVKTPPTSDSNTETQFPGSKEYLMPLAEVKEINSAYSSVLKERARY